MRVSVEVTLDYTRDSIGQVEFIGIIGKYFILKKTGQDDDTQLILHGSWWLRGHTPLYIQTVDNKGVTSSPEAYVQLAAGLFEEIMREKSDWRCKPLPGVTYRTTEEEGSGCMVALFPYEVDTGRDMG